MVSFAVGQAYGVENENSARAFPAAAFSRYSPNVCEAFDGRSCERLG